jgi:resuscitation-promoting factor RpfA
VDAEVRMRDPLPRRSSGWWRPLQPPAVAAGLVLVELVLVRELGTPAVQLRALRHLGGAWADPVGSVLALMALVAEVAVAYVLVALLLWSLAMLPGTLGGLVSRVAFLVTPVVVRRTLDLLVGGTLLALATLTVAAATPPGRCSDRATAVSWFPTGSATGSATGSGTEAVTGPVADAVIGSITGSVTGSAIGSVSPAVPTAGVPVAFGRTRLLSAVDGPEPVATRPTLRRSSAPLPPWLGGGPPTAAPGRTPDATGPTSTPVAPPERPGRGSTLAPGWSGPGSMPPPKRLGPGPTPVPGPGTGSAAGEHIVVPHDTLWDIAAARLAPADRSAANIHRYWQQIYRANRSVVGPDPDLIHPGTRLDVPPYRRGRP